MNSKTLTLSLFLVLFALVSFGQNRRTNYDDQVEEHTITWGNYERTYWVHLPPAEKLNQAVPVLFVLHGGRTTAKKMLKLTYGRFNELADKEGFIVVYPEGIKKFWNDGRSSDKVVAWKEKVDDVGFISKIVEVISSQHKVDSSKIFTSGISNGGFMSSRLLCEKPDVFRGGAILTATISKEYFPNCNPSTPTAVLIMNGTKDKLVPYNGGSVSVLGKKRGEILSTDDYMAFWKEANGCTELVPTNVLPDSDKEDGTTVSIKEYRSCNDNGSLILYKVNGGGHTWPGGVQYLGKKIVGNASREINACDVIWDYFKSLPK